jgi:hypothetical protein
MFHSERTGKISEESPRSNIACYSSRSVIQASPGSAIRLNNQNSAMQIAKAKLFIFNEYNFA